MLTAGDLRRPLLIVTGKGGVGKSTVAGACGLALARRGLKILIVEVAARDDVSRTLASTSGAYLERAVADRVHHLSIDPQHAMKEYLGDHLPLRALADLLTHSRTFWAFTTATPGTAELLTIGKVWELARSRRYDTVILDAPATGHALALLRAPRTFAAATRAGPISSQAHAIAAYLGDSRRTAIVAVSTAEEMPVNETLALRDSLREEAAMDLDGVVFNAVFPRRFSAPEVQTLRAAPASPARHAALFVEARAAQHRKQIARLRRGLRGVPTRTLPYLFGPELDAEALVHLSRKLGR